jgi:hypothetical protein
MHKLRWTNPLRRDWFAWRPGFTEPEVQFVAF